MAEAAEKNGNRHITDLKALKEQITCKVCKRQYQNPKTLPCLHSFCLGCLQQGCTTESSIQCPECKKEIDSQDCDDDSFPDAFLVNRQIELYNFLMKVNGKVDVKCEKCSNKSVKATSFCRDCGKFVCDLCVTIHRSWSEFSSHRVLTLIALKESYRKHIPERIEPTLCTLHTKENTMYCESCEEQICHECIIKSHRDHQYNLVADAAVKHKIIMKSKLGGIHHVPGKLEEAIGTINGISEGFSAKGKSVTRQISVQFDDLEKAIAARRKALLQEITGMVEAKVRLLEDQRSSLQNMKVKVVSCIDFVTQTMMSEHISEFFILEEKMAARVSEVKNQFSGMDLTPVEQPEAHFMFDEDIARKLQTASSVSDGSILYAGTNGSCYFTVNEVITFNIALSSAYYKTKINPMNEIKAEIHSIRDGSVCPATIAVTGSGFAKLQCSFSERGRYALSVMVGDRHISGSPHSFFVKPSTTQFQVPVKTISKLNSPKGLAVNAKNQIILSEENRHVVSVFGRKCKKVLSFGTFGANDAQFSHPVGVAVDKSGCIYVADSKNNRIQKFDSEGNSLATFSGEKSTSGPLNSPTGVKINQNGNLFIVDRGNSRIVVLDENLKFCYVFGSPGYGLGEIQDPWDIAFDKDGFSYVTDTKQHCIQIFNQSGEFRGKIGAQGTQKSRLNRPSGLAIDTLGRIFVCEVGNHRVSIFHTSSEFLECFSTGLSMVNPCAVVVDEDGFVYVSSAEAVHIF